jgi:NAD(P)-dependent dehydrogenase (short-subunit alcohol dehydrogenase family)
VFYCFNLASVEDITAEGAVGGFSEVLNVELAPLGVEVTVLEPGGMRTDWGGSSMAVPPVSEPYRATVGAFAGHIRAELVSVSSAD